MKLREWRIEQGLTQQALADALVCTQTTISFIERSEPSDRAQIPNRSLMVRIYRLTKAAVTPNDFYDLPDLDQLDLPIEPAFVPAPLFDGDAELAGGVPAAAAVLDHRIGGADAGAEGDRAEQGAH